MTNAIRTAELELRLAGWPSVADDLADGIEPRTILGRLDRLARDGEDTDEAAAIIDQLVDPSPMR